MYNRARAGILGGESLSRQLFVVVLAAAGALLRVPAVSGAELSAGQLVAGLVDKSRDVRESSEKQLVKMGPEAIPQLLANADNAKKHDAIVRIFNKMSCDAVPSLIKFLDDDSLRTKAGSMLFQAASPDCARQMGGLLACMESPKGGSYCGAALVRASGPKAKSQLPELKKRMAISDKNLRAYIVAAIGEIGKKASSADPELLAAMKDPAPIVRLAAVVALGKTRVKDQAAREALKAAAGDTDSEVSHEAGELLKALK